MDLENNGTELLLDYTAPSVEYVGGLDTVTLGGGTSLINDQSAFYKNN